MDPSADREVSSAPDDVLAPMRERVVALESQVEDLKQALATARTIGAAIGVVMATSEVPEDEALTILRESGRSTGLSLRTVADAVLQTGVVPSRATLKGPVAEAVFEMAGNIDLLSREELRAAADRFLDDAAPDAGVYFVEVNAVAFVDSTALWILERIRTRAAERGASVTIRNAGPALRRLLDIAGMTGSFDMAPVR